MRFISLLFFIFHFSEGWFQIEDKDNTNVYVSGLPTDITMEEFKEIMTKYGLVMHDPRTKQPKLKLYFDENGQPKGDGRCCYIKVVLGRARKEGRMIICCYLNDKKTLKQSEIVCR